MTPKHLLAELRVARTAWHEEFGVPVSFAYARFLQAIGDVADALDRLTCEDCAKAAKHAYSDATTPGFFPDKCPRHQS
jgi:hypothetical protein